MGMDSETKSENGYKFEARSGSGYWNMFWSEIGSGFGESCPRQKWRGVPPPPPPATGRKLHFS